MRSHFLEAGAFGDPLAEGLVIAGTGHQRLTAFVGDIAQGLLEHQGLVDVDPVEAAAAQVVDQDLVVVFRIISAQRELEAVLPLGRPVAGARVAPGPAQDGFDIPDEAHFG